MKLTSDCLIIIVKGIGGLQENILIVVDGNASVQDIAIFFNRIVVCLSICSVYHLSSTI